MWSHNINSPLVELHIREHREELYRQAKRYRLLREISASRPSTLQHLRTGLADFLITLGVRLKGQHQGLQANTLCAYCLHHSPIAVAGHTDR